MKIRIGPFYAIPGKKRRFPRKLKKRLKTDAAFNIITACKIVSSIIKSHKARRPIPDFAPGGVLIKTTGDHDAEYIVQERIRTNGAILDALGVTAEQVDSKTYPFDFKALEDTLRFPRPSSSKQ